MYQLFVVANEFARLNYAEGIQTVGLDEDALL